MKNHFLILFGLITFWGLMLSCDKPDSKDSPEGLSEMAKEKVFERASTFFKPLPDKIENPENPLSDEKIALGKKLYYDTRLSKDGNNSCNSCHNLETFGVDNLPFSPGDKGELGGRNSPTTLNAAFHSTQFWDGRAKDVEEQAGMPITNPIEMAIPSEEFLVERLSNIEEYQKDFSAAFPDSKKITYENIARAIAAFERTLITPSRFDDYLKGDKKALVDEEIKGLQAFMDVGCITCHAGAQLGGNMFQKFGVFKPYWEKTGSEKIDEGKFEVTQNESDKYFFKVPGLRNIEKTYPYFHDGSIKSLDEAVRIMAEVQLNKELSEEELANIISFLNALTGEVPKEALLSEK